MLVLLRLFHDILFRRRGPEDVPASTALFGLTLLANVLVSQFDLLARGLMRGDGQIFLLISLAMPLSLVWLVLSGQRVGHRYLQTVTGWLGADALLVLLLIPFQMIWSGAPQTTDPTQVPPAAQLALMVLLAGRIWSVWLLGFVVSRALGRSIWVGVAVALLNASFVVSAASLLVPTIFQPPVQ